MKALNSRIEFLGRCCLAAGLVLVLGVGSVYGQQDEDTQQPAPETEGEPDPASEEFDLDSAPVDEESEFRGTNRRDLDLIEGLLEQSDDSIDTGFVYDPGGRRDPFRTLLRAPDEVAERAGPRPEGIPGLMIENLTVTGVWMWPEGPMAQVQSAEDPISYLLSPGTKVFDGEVISITWDREEGGKVVFRQVVRDPTAPKPFKEVVRRVQP